jgi:PRC-barrel domain
MLFEKTACQKPQLPLADHHRAGVKLFVVVLRIAPAIQNSRDAEQRQSVARMRRSGAVGTSVPQDDLSPHSNPLQGRNDMARATAHPDRNCISSEDVRGTWVYGSDSRNIGEIDHLIIDKMSGRVAYAVMSFGGFMGLGHSHYPIPWGALTYDRSLGGFRTNITEQQLRDAPDFSDDSWQDRDWEQRTHQHYGAPEYWDSRAGL